jgi:elongation factor Ts
VKGGVGVAVEVNSETDFVARNSDFQAVVRAIAEVATGCADLEALKGAPLGDKTVEEAVTAKIATIGENLHLRRMASVEGDSVASYVHNAVADNLGKIGVLVALKGADNGIGRQIAMHVAATGPASLSEADLDPALVEREKAVLSEQARASGKPEGVIEKMIAGRMNKFFEEVTLLRQKFVIDPDVTVGKAAADAGVEVLGFVRLAVGEGVEREEEDFAAEVAKTAGR